MSAELLQPEIEASVRQALAEDVGNGDLTANLVPADQQAKATVSLREAAVLCGTAWFDEVFRQLSAQVKVIWQSAEGELCPADTIVCQLSGPARPLLTGERAALNFLQTLSATATTAHHYQAAVDGTYATILDTRKTIPGLRNAQKYAVRTGGAANHRTGLYDGILIKENHISAGGGITRTVRAALQNNADILIEVEVETMDEVREALQSGAHRLLIDNFSPEEMRAAVTLRDNLNPEVKLEASGNVNLETVRSIAATGVDFISIGALTKDIKAIDLSMRFEML